MQSKLSKLSSSSAYKYDCDKDIDVMRVIKDAKEPVYIVHNSEASYSTKREHDQLLKIEIALRKCDRFGLFAN